jgi:polyisoprenoid-binding protein YceI
MKSRLAIISVAALMFCAPLSAGAADFVIDTKGSHASINFRVKHLGFSWLVGRFDTFSGSFSFDDKNPEASKVGVEIDTASVNSNHAERDKHLRGPDFLDVAQFPKATFESTKIAASGPDKATIVGNLTLHGVTKEVTIAATRLGGGSDPWGGFRQGFEGTAKFALKDFGIKKDLGPASQEVELTLHVEGVQK